MSHDQVREIITEIQTGALSIDDAEARILEVVRRAPFEDIGFARIDHHRPVRQGLPEVVFGAGKTPEQISIIAGRLVAAGVTLIVTRTTETAFKAVRRIVPDATFDPTARLIIRRATKDTTGHGVIAIAAAGTSDLPVAEEARLTAEALGNDVSTFYDVGISGLNRLLSEQKHLNDARVIIAVAGMEGALPSVIAGLVSRPVIAVPTSIGYGASFGGVSALLGMLNSCASGVAVVNIDNGFGAATMASLINHLH